METGLAGRTVVVTGGNANIGRGIALAFAAECCGVVIVGRDEAQGKEVGKHGITVNAIAPYGTLPEDLERDVSRGSRFHPEGLYAQLSTTKAELFGAMGGRRCWNGISPSLRRSAPPPCTSRPTAQSS